MLNRTIVVEVEEEKETIVETMGAYVGACNAISYFAHAEQIFDAATLQKHLYSDLREHWNLRSQMTCSALRHVASLYKHKKFSQRTHKREKGVFLSRLAMPLQCGRDWTLLSDGRVSISTIHGRVKAFCKWGIFQRRYIDTGWKPTAARLVRKKQRLELHITIEKEAPEPLPGNKVVGVDLGQNNLATIAFEEMVAVFIKGGFAKDKQRQFRNLYQSLQIKGTRGSKQLLLKISGKQRRWQTQLNHEISNRIVQLTLECGANIIGLERLTGIREGNTRPTRRTRADFHGWGFFQLQQMIVYKAAAVGITVEFVNPYRTSKDCPRCEQLGQRERHSLTCKSCSFELNADLAAARTIARRASAQRHASERRAPVNEPLSTVDDSEPPVRVTSDEMCASL